MIGFVLDYTETKSILDLKFFFEIITTYFLRIEKMCPRRRSAEQSLVPRNISGIKIKRDY